jgi:hypothetical protein
MANPSNVKRVELSVAILAEMLTEGWTAGTERVVRCISGLPAGAQYVRGWMNESNCTVNLVFAHPSFPEILWGETIPILDVTLRTEALPNGNA